MRGPPAVFQPLMSASVFINMMTRLVMSSPVLGLCVPSGLWLTGNMNSAGFDPGDGVKLLIAAVFTLRLLDQYFKGRN